MSVEFLITYISLIYVFSFLQDQEDSNPLKNTLIWILHAKVINMVLSFNFKQLKTNT